MDAKFWPTFNGETEVFCLGEGLTADAESLCPLQSGLDGLLNYPLYHTLTETFNNTQTDMTGLIVGRDIIKSECKV